MLAGINTVFVCPNIKIRDALIRVIEEVGDIKPNVRKDSMSEQRASYLPVVSRVIINTAAPIMHERLGKHNCALALEVADPMVAAKKAQLILDTLGFVGTIHSQAEPEYPEGFLVFMSVPELEGIVLLFWPKNPSPAVLSQLPKPTPW